MAAAVTAFGLLIANWFQGCQTKKAADAAAGAASVAKQTMHIDQRAWLGVVVGRGPIEIGQLLKPPIRIADTGRTPAVHMHGNIVINLLGEKEEPDFSYGHGHPAYEIYGNDLLPNLPQDFSFAVLPKYVPPDRPLNPIVVTDSVKRDIENGTSYIVVHGEIFYDDVFGVHHWIRFCNYAQNASGFREQSVANNCGSYNDTDTNN